METYWRKRASVEITINRVSNGNHQTVIVIWLLSHSRRLYSTLSLQLLLMLGQRTYCKILRPVWISNTVYSSFMISFSSKALMNTSIQQMLSQVNSINFLDYKHRAGFRWVCSTNVTQYIFIPGVLKLDDLLWEGHLDNTSHTCTNTIVLSYFRLEGSSSCQVGREPAIITYNFLLMLKFSHHS